LQNDGKIVVAGGNSDFILARFTSGGAMDNTFGSSGMVTTDFSAGSYDAANAVIVQSDGKIIVGGTSDLNSPSIYLAYFALARYNTAGTLDNTFGTSGLVTTTPGSVGSVNSLGLQSDDKIVAAGTNASHYSSNYAVARFNNSISSTGFEESITNALQVKIIPNPSSGMFSISLPNCRKSKLCVYDILGNCVLNKECHYEENPAINLSACPKGIYFLEIHSENERVVKKLMVE
jgi:uncharacterized delta-60 repeat protein